MTSTGSEKASHLIDADIESVHRELTLIREEMVAEVARAQSNLHAVHPSFRASANNLLHYLALRRRDLRSLQRRLAGLGLSSLGRAESHVLSTVDTVLEVLHRLTGGNCRPSPEDATVVDITNGERLLAKHADDLMGPPSSGRMVRIMVTMPSEAANDYTLVHTLLQHGMDCMRINCAHDEATAWLRMIEHLKRAEQAVGRSCRIVMDLAGPKLRTGPLQPGFSVIRIHPQRDVYGRVVAPARVWLFAQSASHQSSSPADASLPVPPKWLSRLRPGDEITLVDAREAKRTWQVVDVTKYGCWAEASKTTYIVPGTILHHERRAAKKHERQATVGELPHGKNTIILQQGDLLIVTRDLTPGRPATHDSGGKVLTPAMIGCTIPEVFNDVRSGEAIWFDDGKIGGVIEQVTDDEVYIRITHARVGGQKLCGDKGINLPESDLRLAALTPKDLEDLSFAAQHADVVELSFANSAGDVELLQQHLARLRARQPAVVLKIETRRGFRNLPDMLLTAMRAPCCGVMIARGDLAVECGFERLAEVQEEILWICEAAHVPVIWATQVLESLAKKGLPSRAEITDAAMGHRAECVMLNKGPHILTAVKTLDDILRRMQTHQTKKRAMLRELRLAHPSPAGRAGVRHQDRPVRSIQRKP